MKKIALTNGGATIVDDASYEYLNQWKWFKDKQGRVTRTTPGHSTKPRLHRLLLNFPKGDIDHINGDPLDNRLSNLRICSHSDNIKNSSKHKDNKSGYKGVSPDNGKWRASIWVNNKKIYLGRFSDPLEAAQSYNKAAKQYFNEFAKLNYE